MPTINQLIRKGTGKGCQQVDCAYSAGLPAEARRVPQREDHDPQEAEFRPA